MEKSQLPGASIPRLYCIPLGMTFLQMTKNLSSEILYPENPDLIGTNRASFFSLARRETLTENSLKINSVILRFAGDVSVSELFLLVGLRYEAKLRWILTENAVCQISSLIKNSCIPSIELT